MSYSPTLGRWIEQDYVGGYVDGMDLYQFVVGNPISATDPNGLVHLADAIWYASAFLGSGGGSDLAKANALRAAINHELGPRAVKKGVELALASLGIVGVNPQEFNQNFAIFSSDDSLMLDYQLGDKWNSVETIHGEGAYEIALPVAGYALKFYYDQNCTVWTAAVVHATNTFQHYLDAIPFALEGVANPNAPVNADIAEEYGGFSVVSVPDLLMFDSLRSRIHMKAFPVAVPPPFEYVP